ncbi:MAG: hypothetical protein R3B70_42075 [Polyangiaceae bacterium]
MPRRPYRDEEEVKEAVKPDVVAAFRRWARTVPGAPRHLDRQITATEERDETITRVATEVIRRDLSEQWQPAHRRARRSGPIVDPASIDPFAESLDSLRERTERTVRCRGCGGGGLVECSMCAGTGRQRCGTCGGSGQILRQYQKSSRFVRCTVCRASGTVGCGGCSATGRITCAGCAGSGEQIVWWAYVERTRVVLGFAPQSPILAAHRALREERFLSGAELQAFSLFLTLEAKGPIPVDSLSPEDATLRDQLAPSIDRRLERVAAQQLLRFGVLRRDVRYEMCGAEATVVLSGAKLVGAKTREAVAPIRARAFAWASMGLLLLVLTMWSRGALMGPTDYYAGTNRAITVLLLLGLLAGIVVVGGALRALRPGLRFWPLGTMDRAAAGVLAVAVLLGPLVAILGRPTPEEARAAIASGDLARGQFVLDALVATRPPAETADIVADLRLAKAERLAPDVRLAELDALAAEGGARVDEARGRALATRLDAVRAELQGGRPAEALGLLDRWSTILPAGEEVNELRAEAFDKQAGSCGDEGCAFRMLRAALSARATPARRDAVAGSRARLLQSLSARAPASAEPLAQARALRALAEQAAAVQAAAEDDAEVVETARSMLAWVASERAKIPLLGAPPALVDELLERPDPLSPGVGWKELEGVAVHASVSAGQCKGLYVVGSRPGARALSGRGSGLARLLAQATGSAHASFPVRAASARVHDMSKWQEGGTNVVARWRGDTLMELRIGEASP